MYSTGPSGLAVFIVILSLAWFALLVWFIVVWLRVGIRWLSLHPSQATSITPAPTPARFPVPSGQGTPVGSEWTAPPGDGNPAARYRDALRKWAASGEGPSATARRLGISGAAAAQIRVTAFKAAAGNATREEWAQLEPWLPLLLG